MPKTVFEFAKLAALYKTTLAEAATAWAESATDFYAGDAGDIDAKGDCYGEGEKETE